MLMGELQIKYRERLEAVPIAAESKQDQLFVQAYEGQLAGEKFALFLHALQRGTVNSSLLIICLQIYRRNC